MKRVVYVLAALPLAVWAVEGCSSSQTVDDVSGTDSGGGGAGDDGGSNNNGNNGIDSGSSNNDGGPGGDGGIVSTTPGKQLTPVTDAIIIGVTTDGMVVYLNNTDADAGPGGDASTLSSLEVVPVAGGAATVLTAAFDNNLDDVLIAGKTVAFWKNVDQMSGIADSLWVWTAANAKANMIATNSFDRLYDASEDGTHIGFTSTVTATTLTLATAKSDGTSPLNFATTAHIDGNCFPDIAFTKAIAVAQWCTTKAATSGPLSTIDTGAVTPVVRSVATTADFNPFSAIGAQFFTNDTGTKEFWLKGATNIGEIALADGTGATVAEEPGIANGILNSDATKLTYLVSDGGPGSLKSVATTAAAAPLTLLNSVAGILDNGKDYGSLIVHTGAVDQTTNANVARVDLKLASALDAGAPTPLTDAGRPVGYNTTSAYFFYLTDVATTGQIPSGTLKAHPIAGGADKTIAMNAIFPALVDASSKVVFISNIQMTASSVAVNLSAGDGAGAGAAAVVVQGADPGFAVSGTTLVYFTAGKGIYAVAVP